MESNYENQRLANIRNNQQLLASLGLLQPSAGIKRKRGASRKSSKRKNDTKNSSRMPLVATRKSKRLHPGSKPEISSDTIPNVDISEREENPTVAYRYDDSSVLRYVASEEGSKMCKKEGAAGDWSGRLLPQGEGVVDDALKKIYSMDWRNGLLLAGGHQGRVSVFGTRGEEGEVLMSFKASRGWISSMQFVSLDDAESDLLFLTASNDGSVVLWDAATQHEGIPKRISLVDDAHSGGIFSLHSKGTSFVTGSKDRSVVSWQVSPGGALSSVRSIPDRHDGVVKCVRISPGSTDLLASVGNDAALCISDLRDSSSAATVVSGLHGGCCVNSVRWHPTKPNILMTAGFDTRIEMHDHRKSGQAFLVLDSHMPVGLNKVKSIYHPLFVRSGRNVITSGDKTEELTIYCSETGKVVSRGDVSLQATCLTVDDALSSHPKLVAAHRRQVSFFDVL